MVLGSRVLCELLYLQCRSFSACFRLSTRRNCLRNIASIIHGSSSDRIVGEGDYLGARQFSLFDPARTSAVRIIPFLFLITLFSCARKPFVQPVSTPEDKNTRVSLKTLSVVKTQEVLGDELVLVGALGIIENGKLMPVKVFSSYLGKVKKGQVIRLDTIKALGIRLHSGQKASFQLSSSRSKTTSPRRNG